MPFEARPGIAPGKPEDMFIYRPSEDRYDALLIATLGDGHMLVLGDGPAENYPSTWPLWYYPYVIEHPDAVSWLHERRERLLELRPDLIDLYENVYTQGLGGYFSGISDLEVGTSPKLTHKIYDESYSRPELVEVDRFSFGSPVVSFEPVSSLKEAKRRVSI